VERKSDAEARLEGAILAVNTIEHYLNNQLARTAAYCELLIDDPRLPSDLRAQALKAMEGVHAASATVATMRRLARLEGDGALRGVQVLDLELSVARPTGD
jgi:hypothetical protein